MKNFKKLIYLLIIAILSLTMTLPVIAAEEPSTTASQQFPFTVYLKDCEGNALTGSYHYEGTIDGQAVTGTIANGDVIYLGDADFIDILDLPEGTRYEVVEGETEGYVLSGSFDTTGTIAADIQSHAKFVNREEGQVSEDTALHLSIHGGKIVDHGTTDGKTLLQITKLVSDYTPNSDQWLRTDTDRAYTIHVMCGSVSGDTFVSKDCVSSVQGNVVSAIYDQNTGIGTLVLKDKCHAILDLSAMTDDDGIYLWEEPWGDDLGPYCTTEYGCEGVLVLGTSLSWTPDDVEVIVLGHRDLSETETNQVVIYNNILPRGQVSFFATDAYGNNIEGAEFELRDPAGDTLGTTVSDGEKEVVFQDLWVPEGTYSLEETEGPFGYNQNPEIYQVIVQDTYEKSSETSYELVAKVDIYGQDDTSLQMPIRMIHHMVGIELPSTGGSGSLIVYTLSGNCAIVTAMLILTKKSWAKRRIKA